VLGICTDNVGNGVGTSTSFQIDSVAPGTGRITGGTQGENGWYKSAVDFALFCSDPAPGSGCWNTVYYVDGVFHNYAGQFSVSQQGPHLLQYQSGDGAANVEPMQSFSFGVDTGGPDVLVQLDGTPGNAGWFRSSVRVTLTCTDSVSGPASGSLKYSLNGGALQTYTAPFTVAAQGTTTLSAQCKDNAGWLDTASATLRIDSQAPLADVSITEGSNDLVTIAWAASDPTSGLTGNALVQQNFNGGAYSTVCSKAVSGTGTNSGTCNRTMGSPGTYCWRFVANDLAGNSLTTSPGCIADIDPQ
jgi:hypothetical protein